MEDSLRRAPRQKTKRTQARAKIIPCGFDWPDWLPSWETISSAVVSVPVGLMLVSESNTATQHNVRISGGTAGMRYTVRSRVTTTPSGYIEDRSREFVIKEQ